MLSTFKNVYVNEGNGILQQDGATVLGHIQLESHSSLLQITTSAY